VLQRQADVERVIVRPDTTGIPAIASSGAVAATRTREARASTSSSFLISSRLGPGRTASMAIVFVVGAIACENELPAMRSIL
jgi:hypothetical protein